MILNNKRSIIHLNNMLCKYKHFVSFIGVSNGDRDHVAKYVFRQQIPISNSTLRKTQTE